MWIIVFFFPVFKANGSVCDGSINQLGGNVLESHRRYWHCRKTGTVSDPAATTFPFSLTENTFFHTLTPFPSSSTLPAFLSHPHLYLKFHHLPSPPSARAQLDSVRLLEKVTAAEVLIANRTGRPLETN